ncbi:MAG: IPT/TIG domain-containing protein [Acidimicrobiales bacterium]
MMRKGLRQLRKIGGQESEPDRPVPSPRELDALAGAVRRAREYAGKESPDQQTSDGAPGTTTSRPNGTGTRSSRAPLLGRSRRAAVVLPVVVVAAAAGVALALFDLTRHVASPPPPTLVRLPGPTVAKSSKAQQTTTSSSKPAQTTTTLPTTTTLSPTTTTTLPTTTSRPTSSSTVAPAAASAPGAVSITPSQGLAGVVVVVRGRNFFSANGLVLARVNGQPTQTRCPTQTSCLVTIPKIPGGPSRVTVTITTESGTSNSVPFKYI